MTGEHHTLVDDAELGPPRHHSSDLNRGDLVGRYVILHPLGCGGMGSVFAAYDPELDRKVAIKMVHTTSRGTDRPQRDRLRMLREAQAMARLTHPNVVTVYDAGMVAGRIFLAMQLVSGTTLKEWLSLRPRPWPTIIDVFVRAGRGLAAAHAAGLVHRDFKPENVLVGHDKSTRVTDFGLARARTNLEHPLSPPRHADLPRSDVLGKPLTEEGTRVGTPAYMSPEQHLGYDIDAASDQFSFCVALYEALYGAHPFHGKDLYCLVTSVTMGHAVAPPRRSPISTPVRQAILRGLNNDPLQRWPTMNALIAVLSEAPRRASDRWFRKTYTGVVIGTGVALVVTASPSPASPCRHIDETIETIWSDDARGTLGATAARLGLETASAAAMTEVFDRYAATWRTQAHRTCLAGQRPGGDAVLQTKARCLNRRVIELDAGLQYLGATLRRSDLRLVVENLIAPSTCDENRRFAHLEPRPQQALQNRRFERIETHLAGLKWVVAAHDADGETRVRTVRAEALAMGYAPLVAEARADYATLLVQRNAFDFAAYEYRRALDAAARGGAVAVEEAIWIDLVRLHGVSRGDLAGAQASAITAKRAIERAGSRPSSWHRFHTTFAAVLHHHGRLAEALTHSEAALASIRGNQPAREVVTLVNHGTLLHESGQLAAAEMALIRSLELAHATKFSDTQSIAYGELQLAHIFRERGLHDDAATLYRQARTIFVRIHGPHTATIGQVSCDLADIALLHGRLPEAEAEAGRARAISEREDDALLQARARAILGNVALEQRRFPEAKRQLRAAKREQIKRLGPEHRDVFRTEIQMCELARRQGHSESARICANRTIEGLTRALGADHRDIAPALVVAGRSNLDLRAYPTAINRLERAIAVYEQTPGPTIDHTRAQRALAEAIVANERSPSRHGRELAVQTITKDPRP